MKNYSVPHCFIYNDRVRNKFGGMAESESRSTTGIPHSYTDEFIVTYSLRTMINLYAICLPFHNSFLR